MRTHGMTRHRRRPHGGRMTVIVAAVVCISGAGRPILGQDGGQAGGLSVDEAVREALEQNAGIRVSEAQARLARAKSRGASSFLWPALAVESGVVSSDDPVFAFGTKLQQGRFSAGDLDIDALNSPDVVSDWTLGVGVEWDILSPTRWAAMKGDRFEAEAVAWDASRTRDAVEFQARVLFHRALQADSRLSAAIADEAAKAEGLAVVTRRVDEGDLTEADRLRAYAELAGARAARVLTVQERENALVRLAVFMGRPPHAVPTLAPWEPSQLIDGEPSQGDRELPGGRADLRAREAYLLAARARASAERRSRLPSLTGFAGVKSHSAAAFDNREARWSAGVLLSLPVFTGFKTSSGVAAAAAAVEIAEVQLDESVRQAAAEWDEALRAVEVRREARAASAAAAASAVEAARLVRRRFEEGMGTTLDLLQAQARAAVFRSAATDAAAAYEISLARLRYVGGANANSNE